MTLESADLSATEEWVMKGETMRAPLIKSGAVLLVFVLLAYFTSSSPEGSVLGSIGMIIVSAFRLVQWSVGMVIALAVSIACLFGIFLGAVAMVDRYAAATMYQGLKQSLAVLFAPVLGLLGSARKTAPATLPLAPAVSAPVQPPVPTVDKEEVKGELKAVLASELEIVAASQQNLDDRIAALAATVQELESKSTGYAEAAQVDAIAKAIADSGKLLGSVQETLSSLEARVNDTMQQLQALTPEKVLGDLPGRLQKIEQSADSGFDPKPLVETVAGLQKELDELKKKSPAKTKKKA
jgi:hypothetical protein